MLGHQAADRRFARAHETDQGEIVNGARRQRIQRRKLSANIGPLPPQVKREGA